MELGEGAGAFSELLGTRVRDQNGRSLGIVYEAQAVWRDGAPQIEKLLVGRRAIWRRLRGPGGSTQGISWAAITAFDSDGLVVHR
jgi:hypothetical protein